MVMKAHATKTDKKQEKRDNQNSETSHSLSDDEESLEMTINNTPVSGANNSSNIGAKHGHLFHQLRHTVERMLNNISQA
jgi:hypothetical protein